MNITRFYQASGMLLLLATASVQAATIMDNYIGANGHGLGDVIGNQGDFQVNFLTAEINGTVLNVSIDTTFAGKGDDGLFSSYSVSGNGVGYGDLFLSSLWSPNGEPAYENDDASNGTIWTHGFSIDDPYMGNNSVGDGVLYNLTSSNNDTDIKLSDDYFNSGIFRNNQEVAVDKDSDGVVALANSGVWSITDTTVDFEIDLLGTGLLDGNELALRWQATCANDVIEGTMDVSTVPVPAAAWLFGTGLIGLVGVARRRNPG